MCSGLKTKKTHTRVSLPVSIEQKVRFDLSQQKAENHLQHSIKRKCAPSEEADCLSEQTCTKQQQLVSHDHECCRSKSQRDNWLISLKNTCINHLMESKSYLIAH